MDGTRAKLGTQTALGETPRISAGLMAQRTVPRLQDVLVHVTKTPAAAFAAGVSRVGEDGHYEGLIHVAFSSEEAQSFIEWVMRRATPDELAALAEAEERRAE